MTTVKRWIYAARPESEVSRQRYRLETEETELQPVRGEVVVEGRFWSVDPYMRIQQSADDTWEAPHPINEVQDGSVVGRVVAVGENTDGFQPGDWVETYMGWRTHGVRAISTCRKLARDYSHRMDEMLKVMCAMALSSIPRRFSMASNDCPMRCLDFSPEQTPES